MIEYKVDEKEYSALTKVLDTLKASVKDMRPAWERVSDIIYASLEKNFDAQGRPSTWIPLSPRTQRERASQGFGASGPILERTGELRRAVSNNSGYLTWLGSPSELKFIPDMSFGKFQHHTGYVTSFGATVPARPFLFIQDDDHTPILQELAFYLAKSIQAAVS